MCPHQVFDCHLVDDKLNNSEMSLSSSLSASITTMNLFYFSECKHVTATVMSETSSTHILYQLKCIHMEYDFSISAVNAPDVQEGLFYENTFDNSLNYLTELFKC